jgi:hypothetical protein
MDLKPFKVFVVEISLESHTMLNIMFIQKM